MTRDIRDILAECMRRERYGLIRPLWADAVEVNPEGCEQSRLFADHLIRLLKENGVDLVRAGEGAPPPAPPESRIITRDLIVGENAERWVRWTGDRWEIVHVAGEVEAVEQSFTTTEALLNAGLVFRGDPQARKIPAVGRQLAALVDIYRLNGTLLERGGR